MQQPFSILKIIDLYSNTIIARILFFILLWTCLGFNSGFAQIDINVSYQEYFEKNKLDYKTPNKVKSVTELNTLSRQLIEALRRDGYWNAQIDTLISQKQRIEVRIKVGKRAFWKDLSLRIPPEIEEQAVPKFDPKKFINKAVLAQDIEYVQAQLVDWAEDNGYPMARTRLDSAGIEEDSTKRFFSAQLSFEKGSFIVFDSLVIDGNVKVKKDFLMNYLYLKVGQKFRQSTVDNASRLIKNLPYVRLKAEPSVEFRYDRAYLRLNLEKVRSNQFDGVIGFLPNNPNTSNPEENGLLLTGQVKLHLLNPFGRGKTIKFEWQRIRPEAQTFLGEYRHPNFLKTPLEVGGSFNFVREDSTFSIFERGLHIAYPSARLGTIGIFTSLQTSNRTGVIRNSDTARVANADSRFFHYGVLQNYSSLDDFYFPRKGWHIQSQISLGNKSITDSLSRSRISEENNSQEDFDLPQLSAQISADLYLQMSKLSTLRLKSQFRFVESEFLFLNELLRVGGLETMRGFDPNTFFVSRYGLLGAEWRFYFEKRSFLMAFVEQGAVRSFSRRNEANFDLPLSVGTGLSFATKTGVFYFVYAMGRSDNQAFGINNSKIHFGLLSQF